MHTRLRPIAARLPTAASPLWLVVVLAFAAVLRWYHISANSLWFDEAFSWLLARQPAWVILTGRLEPIFAPLYHFLHHFWIPLGESEAALRSFSALCNLLTLPVVYAIGRRLFNPTTGLTAAALIAILPFQVYFAQEARPYALVMLLAALLLWAFMRAWQSGDGYGTWIIFGVLAGLNFYAHYFVVFTMLVLNAFALLSTGWSRRPWRGLLVADLVALVVVAPQLSSAWAQVHQVASHFWLALPSVLEPLRTLDYLLFGHTTPRWLVPVALFITLALLVMVAWTALRASRLTRAWLVLMLALVLAPMVLVLLVSWVVVPVYLDRSFSLVTPAYALLLAWGVVSAPRRSPVPLLCIGLVAVIFISLGNHYAYPDPAKPPFRDVSTTIGQRWQTGDVLLHLHDSSYLPLVYYAPYSDSYLLNSNPDTWLPAYTWDWAGRRTSVLSQVVNGKARLWLVVMPRRLDDHQRSMLAQVEARYRVTQQWRWEGVDPVELRLYDLPESVLP